MDPDKWLDRLYPKLVARSYDLMKYEDAYVGNHPLPFLSPAHAAKMRSAFRQMLEESRTNFMRLLIDVVDERLRIEGIRLSATSDLTSDKDSWDIWQHNQMDSLSRSAMLDSLIKGISYISVWPSDGEYATIAVEDAKETIVEYTPGTNFRKRDAALKIWSDKTEGLDHANIFLPDSLHKYARKISGGDEYGTEMISPAGGTRGWELVEVVDNVLGVVPIIPLRNRGRLLVEGESEIYDAIPVQNQINGFLFLLALAGYFGAHRQRWATGLTLIEDDATGEVQEPFDVAIDRLLVAEEENVKFGEFAATDLGGYLKAIDQKIAHLAITTRTPKHYLLPEGQNPSGDAIKSSESGLIRRVERKQSSNGEAFEEVMALARKANGDGDTPVDSEIVWANPATESEAARTDAALKKYTAGLIPAEQALEDLGYSQTQISRIMTMKAGEALLQALVPASVAPVPPAAPSKPAVIRV